MNKVEVLKRFFGDKRPVSNREVLDLRKADSKAYDEMSEQAAQALGVEINEKFEVPPPSPTAL